MNQFDVFGPLLDPTLFFKMTARMQCETMAFVSRRARAYADLPKVLASCHFPDDVLTEQVRFWQIAQRQYMESLSRTFSAVPPVESPAPAVAAKPAPRRDYLVVAERPANAAQEQAAPAAPEATVLDKPVRARRSA